MKTLLIHKNSKNGSWFLYVLYKDKFYYIDSLLEEGIRQTKILPFIRKDIERWDSCTITMLEKRDYPIVRECLNKTYEKLLRDDDSYN